MVGDNTKQKLYRIKRENLDVCIFGCGLVGSGSGYDILKFLGVRVSFYCDNNQTLWGKKIRDGVNCFSPDKLFETTNVACFVMVGYRYMQEILEQLKEYGIDIVIRYNELISLDVVVNRFIDECVQKNAQKEKGERIWTEEMVRREGVVCNYNKRKYALYTCITGGYDSVNEPAVYSEDCDYYLISDYKPEKLNIYKWIDVNQIVPDTVVDNSRKNRFCKILAPFIFSEYEYTCYIDGNMQVIGDWKSFVNSLGESGVSTYLYPHGADCLYEHALAMCIAEVDDIERIFKQVDKYSAERMPRNFGLRECGVLFRNNHSLLCRRIMLDWWNEVFNYSYRDQISFPYCLWKNQVKISDVGIMGNNCRISECFRLLYHEFEHKR